MLLPRRRCLYHNIPRFRSRVQVHRGTTRHLIDLPHLLPNATLRLLVGASQHRHRTLYLQHAHTHTNTHTHTHTRTVCTKHSKSVSPRFSSLTTYTCLMKLKPNMLSRACEQTLGSYMLPIRFSPLTKKYTAARVQEVQSSQAVSCYT